MFSKHLRKFISVLIITTFFFSSINISYASPSSKSLFKNKKVDYDKISNQSQDTLQKKQSVLKGEDAKQLESQEKASKKILQSNLSDISQIHIPQELGRVVEVYQGAVASTEETTPLIVGIQDLHTNPEAELNLAKILELLLKDYNMGLVCSEGADGKIDTSPVSSFPDYGIRERVARIFINSGELTGEEYLSIKKYPDLPMWGIETRDIYFKNIIGFNKIMKFSPSSQVFISQTKKAIVELKPKVYSKDLLDLDQKEAEFSSQKLDTAKYIQYLTNFTKKSNISMANYKNISLLTETMEKEKTIDQLKIMNQSQNLLLNLQSSLQIKSLNNDLDSLMARANLYKDQKISPFSFYSYLKDLANKHLKEDFSAKYPELNNFVDYLTKVNSLDSTKLFTELEDLNFTIKEALSKNDEQKTLIKLDHNISFLENFFNLKVSNEDLDYYLNNKDSHKVAFFKDFLPKTLKRYNINAFIDYNPALIDNHLQELEDFYKIVKDRDIAMVTNAISEIEKRNVKLATLVHGGFHTKGITKLLREKGYSYIIVSPYSKTDMDEENYHFLLSGRRKPIEEILKKEFNLPKIVDKFTKTLRVGIMFADTGLQDALNALLKRELGISTGDTATLQATMERLHAAIGMALAERGTGIESYPGEAGSVILAFTGEGWRSAFRVTTNDVTLVNEADYRAGAGTQVAVANGAKVTAALAKDEDVLARQRLLRQAYVSQRKFATLDDVDVTGKTVLVRPDLNVQAQGGHILNPDSPHARVIAAADTLKELVEKNAKVVVIFHQGRPGEPDFMDIPDEHAAQLEKLIGHPVKFVNDLFGSTAIQAIQSLKPGEILVLKPVRAKDLSTGKILEENPYFVSLLERYIDLFVLDGFSVSHRDSPSVTGFVRTPMVAGRLMEREIKGATKILAPSQPHLVVVGGGKIAEKLSEFESALTSGRATKVLLGGRLANLALVAAQLAMESVDMSSDGLFQLAVATVGQATADELQKSGDLNEAKRLAKLLTEYREKVELPIDMVSIVVQGEVHEAQVVTLTNGRVPEGFNLLLSSIGPETAAHYAAIASRTDEPFASAFVIGPLGDTRYDELTVYSKEVLDAVSRLPFWSTGGGDTDALVEKIGLTPTYASLADSALAEFKAGKLLPGVQLLAENHPDVMKPGIVRNDEEAHVLAYAAVLNILLGAANEFNRSHNEEARLIARSILYNRGTKVDAIAMGKTRLLTSSVISHLWSDLIQTLAGLETFEVNAQNPWFDFSMTTLRDRQDRPISADAVRQALGKSPDVIVIQVPPEISKKGKAGKAGEIDTKKFADRILKILDAALRASGIDPNTQKSARFENLPPLVQVLESSISGELKIATFVPTPDSHIAKLMQLARDAGIDLKALFEKEMATPKAKDAKVELFGDPKPAPVFEQLVAETPDNAARPLLSPLAGLKLGGAQINESLQTIFIEDPKAVLDSAQLKAIVERIQAERKVIRIVVPMDTEIEQKLTAEIGNFKSPGIKISSHIMTRHGLKHRAFMIAPWTSVNINGWGNEAIKLAPAFEIGGFSVSITINSLDRSERVIDAFMRGLSVYVTDRNEHSLQQLEEELRSLLIAAFTAQERNKLTEGILASERSKPEVTTGILTRARELGRTRADLVFKTQYKGFFSKALMDGAFDVVADASPEKIGAQNKERLYTPASSKYPNMKFIYQGGEAASLADASFSAVVADYDKAGDMTHLRQVSCNTTGLTSILGYLIRALGLPLVVDNQAIRRDVDPGDLKGSVVSLLYSTAYHHGPDARTALSDRENEFVVALNTDAAQAGGSMTRFHIHALTIRRADRKPLDKRAVQGALAVQSRVALVDYPNGKFDTARLAELTLNLLPQQLSWIPEGANHPLVPTVTVWETDDPSELMLIYAVPQESIVAAGNVDAANALLGLASQEASLAMMNDGMGITDLVSAIESRLPVRDDLADFTNNTRSAL